VKSFPGSVVEVPTAVPAFIGYTEKARDGERSLLHRPRRIASMAEFRRYFGGAPGATYALTTEAAADPDAPVPPGSTEPVVRAGENGTEASWFLARTSPRFYLYHSMLLFYQNGGGRCWLVSVGDYGGAPDADELRAGIAALREEREPTMVVVPDAVLLGLDACISVQREALRHCGEETKSRVAILDIHQGYRPLDDRSVGEAGNAVDVFRGEIGESHLDFGAAYYPWIETTVVERGELGLGNLADPGRLATLLEREGRVPEELWAGLAAESLDPAEAHDLNEALLAASPSFREILRGIREDLDLLPPSGAIAGVYTRVDAARDVWKAPANVSLSSVVEPAVTITDEDQADLNAPPGGKSVNALRSFVGEGTLVWGARTLDGNSPEWRYVPVRRTMIMLEQSIEMATKAYVFEPNDADTWDTIEGTIRNLLARIWRRGGLAGATPDEAFGVRVGLGETMTAEEIEEGILRVIVHVALTRPAEFMEITVEQRMQTS